MSEPAHPRYDWGQRVAALVDLRNDGSFPDSPPDALLVGQGSAGEVVQVGQHAASGTPVYMVEFGGRRVVGCLEHEIGPLLAAGRAVP